MSGLPRRRLPPLLLAAAAAGAALGGGYSLLRDGRIATVSLATTPPDGGLRIAGWVQPGLGLDDGKGYLPVEWAEGERPRSGSYLVATGTVRDGILREARGVGAWLGAAVPAPELEQRVRHLSRRVRLPQLEQGRVADEAPVVAVTRDGVFLEGFPVLPLESGLPADGPDEARFPVLAEALRAHVTARRGPPVEGRLFIAADVEVPATTLGAVLSAAAAAGLPEWRIVTEGKITVGAVSGVTPTSCQGPPDGSCLPDEELGPADPLADLEAEEALQVIGVKPELSEPYPPGADLERLRALLAEELPLKRCVAFAPDAEDVRVRLTLDEARPGAGGPVRPVLRVAVERARYAAEALRCVSVALGRLEIPVTDAAAAPGPVPDLVLAMRLVPREDGLAADRYMRRRSALEPFLSVPTVVVDRDRILVSVPYPLPDGAAEQGRPLHGGPEAATAPLEILRNEEVDAFARLAVAIRFLVGTRPEGSWPVVVAAPGISAEELARALAAVRGSCRDVLCTSRANGYPSAVIRTASGPALAQ